MNFSTRARRLQLEGFVKNSSSSSSRIRAQMMRSRPRSSPHRSGVFEYHMGVQEPPHLTLDCVKPPYRIALYFGDGKERARLPLCFKKESDRQVSSLGAMRSASKENKPIISAEHCLRGVPRGEILASLAWWPAQRDGTQTRRWGPILRLRTTKQAETK